MMSRYPTRSLTPEEDSDFQKMDFTAFARSYSSRPVGEPRREQRFDYAQAMKEFAAREPSEKGDPFSKMRDMYPSLFSSMAAVEPKNATQPGKGAETFSGMAAKKSVDKSDGTGQGKGVTGMGQDDGGSGIREELAECTEKFHEIIKPQLMRITELQEKNAELETDLTALRENLRQSQESQERSQSALELLGRQFSAFQNASDDASRAKAVEELKKSFAAILATSPATSMV